MSRQELTGTVLSVNGPIVKAAGLSGIRMFDIAEVGADLLIGEVIRLEGAIAVIQVYEDNTGLKPGDTVRSFCMPLSVQLGPGLISAIYDGIQRPLVGIERECGSYIKKGIKLPALDTQKQWEFEPEARQGDTVQPGYLLGTVQESPLVKHKVLVPSGVKGRLTFMATAGLYTIENTLYTVENDGACHDGRLAAYWPVRKPRPVGLRRKPSQPLITGQRIIDTFFPLARGGTAAIPGGFGTGKTMTQHALAKWCTADIIVYIGCGERGNEMTEVLTDFPRLVDERSGRPLIERTVMIANTSNMPVPAREVSIYTGVTIAEYYRDMGYSVAVMADSTSRWAEALRELASRLGDMPAEEGFPPYLATRLAEFYERAGAVTTLSGADGDITIVGAVSPPGGDFSEPVTQHTTRFVRCFWALDKVLADARHYPSISWIDSYTEYLPDIRAWWEGIDPRWFSLRSQAMNLLLEDHRLQQIVKLVGPDALPPEQRLILFCAELIKNAFLQQNSFDTLDKYCSAEKQLKLLDLLTRFYNECARLLEQGVPLAGLLQLKAAQDAVRLKSEIASADAAQIDGFTQRMNAELAGLQSTAEGAHRKT